MRLEKRNNSHACFASTTLNVQHPCLKLKPIEDTRFLGIVKGMRKSQLSCTFVVPT